jgi:hypothetical protein
MNCTRCKGTGFLNAEQLPPEDDIFDDFPAILRWISETTGHDVQICDCCGDGDGWYGVPGEHYNNTDPPGRSGPYAYNGGLCECD